MNHSFLTNTALFHDTTPDEAKEMLSCLGSREKKYKKGETIYHVGEVIDSMGMVLSGSVNIEIDDLWGNKTILAHVDAGGIFAETYACVPGEPLMINVVACDGCIILFLNATKILSTCSNSCSHHNKLIRNLLHISAQKNLVLSRRSLHTSPKSIRGRLMSYFSEQAKHSGNYEFTIPYNRQQLADYLGVDRSALSAELSKMQKENLITYNKNKFVMQYASI